MKTDKMESALQYIAHIVRHTQMSDEDKMRELHQFSDYLVEPETSPDYEYAEDDVTDEDWKAYLDSKKDWVRLEHEHGVQWVPTKALENLEIGSPLPSLEDLIEQADLINQTNEEGRYKMVPFEGLYRPDLRSGNTLTSRDKGRLITSTYRTIYPSICAPGKLCPGHWARYGGEMEYCSGHQRQCDTFHHGMFEGSMGIQLGGGMGISGF